MRNVLIGALLLLCLSFSQSFGQVQFQTGVYSQQTLYSIFVAEGYGGCWPAPSITWFPDSTIYPFLTGVELMWVVTSVNDPYPSSIKANGITVSVGDTLPIDSLNHGWGFTFAAYSGDLTLDLVARGTPQNSGETYPCHFDNIQTLAWCENWGRVIADTTQPLCSVTPASIAPSETTRWEIGPNPAQQTLSIRGDDHWSSLRLYDVQGRVLQEIISDTPAPPPTLEVSDLSPGIYFLDITGEAGRFRKKVLIE